MEISGNIVDVLNNKIFPGTVVFEGEIITEIKKENKTYHTYILPGFIDAHCHIESSMMPPSEFARIAVTHGTVATIADPHEIANVLGLDGIYFMIENGKMTDFKFSFGAPSCVPASEFETTGASIDAESIDKLFKDREVKFLGEVMNFPGVIMDDPLVMKKLYIAKKFGKPIDGHAPGLVGKALKKYIDAGITTDHETFGFEEGEEKIRLGMKLIIREGSAAKNFDVLYPLIEKYPHMCMLCSDDEHPHELVKGHINAIVKRAVSFGIPLFDVLRCACVNPVFHYNLDVGLLRVGDKADFIEVDSLENFNVIRTCINGKIVAEKAQPLMTPFKPVLLNKFEAKKKVPSDFAISGNKERIANIIEAQNGQVITGWIKLPITPEKGFFEADTNRDILKIVLVCRYNDKPPVVAFVKNFGLKRGAIASSVAHDSHNIIAVGTTDYDLCRAVNLIVENRGGLSVVSEDFEEILPLPLAGLMGDISGYEIAEKYAKIDMLAKRLGSNLDAPFMTLSFMALSVIPQLKLTDRGLFSIVERRFISTLE